MDWHFHPRDFGSVLHCVEINGAFHFALNVKQDTFLYKPPKDAIGRQARCCRAEKKLEEVFTALGMLHQQFGLAMDIGESSVASNVSVTRGTQTRASDGSIFVYD